MKVSVVIPVYNEEKYSPLLYNIQGHHTLIGPNMALTQSMWKKIRDKACLDEKYVHEDIDLAIHVNELGGKILHDHSLVVHISGRRIRRNPTSFLLEYPYRLVKTIRKHKSTIYNI